MAMSEDAKQSRAARRALTVNPAAIRSTAAAHCGRMDACTCSP